MAGVKDRVVDVQMDHPDRVENFAEYQRGEGAQAGNLTIVVRDAESVPKVLEAAEQAMAADQPAAHKRTIERAAAHLVRIKVMEKQRELKDSGKTLDIDALWNGFDKIAQEELAKLPESPTADKIEEVVRNIEPRWM
jgi:hypothetical protein